MDAKELLERYYAGTATEAEKALVETWYLKYKDTGREISPELLMADQRERLLFIINHENEQHHIRILFTSNQT